MTQAERERMEETAKIARRHAEQLSNEISEILNDSGFDTDYYGELRGMLYRAASFAQQLMEERVILYEILRKGSVCDHTSSKTDSPNTPTSVT
jgi:hypothetical protein